MDEDLSNRASILPWIWVMEVLARFKQVDVSVLHDLIELVPELPDDLGKNMREMLALRCLEFLFDPSNGVRNGDCSTLDSKVGLDFSKSCEDVLQHILHETSLSDLKIAGPELLKWDVRPFIIHKRAGMPKLALQQLKDSILEGIHPYADSLKERSGLTLTSAGDGIPVNNGNHNALTHRVNGSCFDTQHMGAKGNLIPTMLENGNQLLQKDPCNRNLLLSKRGRNRSATENMVGDFHENQNTLNDGDNLHINAKKQKQCPSSSIQSIEENPVPLRGTEPLEDSSARVMPVSEREGCDLAKDQIGTLKEGRVLEDGHDEHTVSVRCGHNSDDEFHHNQSETSDNATMICQGPSADEPCKDIAVNKDIDDSEHCVEPRPLIGPYIATMMVQEMSVDEVKDDSEHCAEPRTSSGPLLNKTLEDEFHHNQSGTLDSATIMLQDPSTDKPFQHVFVNEDKNDGEHCVEPRPFTGSFLPCSASVMVQDISEVKPGQKISVEEIKDDSDNCAEPRTSSVPLLNKTLENESQCNCGHDFQLKAPCAASLDGSQQKIITNEAEEVMDLCCEAETSNDSDECHNYKIDVSKKKLEFLRSQCKYSHDSLASAGCTEHNFCVRCNEGGQLLVCNTRNCPLVVHENCLGFSSRFDGNGNFYCPFCVYSLAISEYLEAKKKASLADTELNKFIHMDLKHQPKELMQQAEPSASSDNVNATLREEEATVTTGTLNEFTNQGQAHHEENTDVIPFNQRQAEEGFHQEVSGQQIADPPREPVWALNIDGEGTSGDETNKSIIFNYSIRLRRRESYQRECRNLQTPTTVISHGRTFWNLVVMCFDQIVRQ
ncbi:uncharacterized protein LOC112016036 isoform X2 [Quercus suber]|uniref:uncharacterized protein LOC112016036 isoform X2 n=1 Tax=Quercus suber TaxID=58331 RepID=UPI000CE16F6C|nr:uncharacterized protein LOC112016036 isoform X2 [Quercus suber]